MFWAEILNSINPIRKAKTEAICYYFRDSNVQF